MHSEIGMTGSEFPIPTPGGEIVVYEAPGGEVRVDVPLEQETVWLTQRQMAEVLQTSTDNVSLHLRNIYSNGELEESATTEDFSTVRTEGKRQVRRVLKHYNLNAIIEERLTTSPGAKLSTGALDHDLAVDAISRTSSRSPARESPKPCQGPRGQDARAPGGGFAECRPRRG